MSSIFRTMFEERGSVDLHYDQTLLQEMTTEQFHHLPIRRMSPFMDLELWMMGLLKHGKTMSPPYQENVSIHVF